MNKKRIIIATVLFFAAVFSISMVTAKISKQAEPQESTASTAQISDNRDISRTTFQVSNLSCGSCLATIEEELRKYDGMVGMEADLSSGLITVGHTSQFPGPQIAEAITLAGYPARLATAEQAKALLQKAGNGGGRSGCGGGCCGVRPPQG